MCVLTMWSDNGWSVRDFEGQKIECFWHYQVEGAVRYTLNIYLAVHMHDSEIHDPRSCYLINDTLKIILLIVKQIANLLQFAFIRKRFYNASVTQRVQVEPPLHQSIYLCVPNVHSKKYILGAAV